MSLTPVLPEPPRVLPSPSPKTTKNIHPKKNSLYFRKWNFLALILKNYYIYRNENLTPSSLNSQNFSLKKFLIFFPKKSHSEKISYISGDRNLHFSAKAWKIEEIRRRKQKWNYLVFWEIEILSIKLKKFIIFQEGTCKAWKFLIFTFLHQNPLYQNHQKKFLCCQ